MGDGLGSEVCSKFFRRIKKEARGKNPGLLPFILSKDMAVDGRARVGISQYGRLGLTK